MIYYAPPSTEQIRDAMTAGLLGCINTPEQARKVDPRWDIVADNGCFSNKWESSSWWSWLQRQPPARFAVCPDVVDLSGGDTHEASLELWELWAPRIVEIGHTPAFVLHQGATLESIPDAAVLFIGGSTEWKLSSAVWEIVAARRDSTWIHMGRVNTWRRLETAKMMGCHSADGTGITYQPETHLPEVLGWLNRSQSNPTLWDANVNDDRDISSHIDRLAKAKVEGDNPRPCIYPPCLRQVTGRAPTCSPNCRRRLSDWRSLAPDERERRFSAIQAKRIRAGLPPLEKEVHP